MKFACVKTSAWRFCALLTLLFVFQAQRMRAQQAEPERPKTDSSRASPAIDTHPRDPDEDWNSLSIGQSALHAEKPLLGERDELPDFTRELLQVRWRAGDPIDLYVIRPRNVEKPPTILYLYSYPSDTDRFRDDGFCRRATRGGFAAVGFASALTAARYHDRPMKQWFVSELQESLVTSVHDVQMILDYLSTRGDLDMDRIGMLGQGSGGSIAIMAAAVDPRIKVLDVLDPWGDWPDWLAKSARVPDTERAGYLEPEFLRRVAPFDPVEWLPKLGSRPVRIQHVMDDPITPATCKKQIELAAPRLSAQVVEYDNARALLDASTGGKLFQWIKDHLLLASQRKEAERNIETGKNWCDCPSA